MLCCHWVNKRNSSFFVICDWCENNSNKWGTYKCTNRYKDMLSNWTRSRNLQIKNIKTAYASCHLRTSTCTATVMNVAALVHLQDMVFPNGGKRKAACQEKYWIPGNYARLAQWFMYLPWKQNVWIWLLGWALVFCY